MDEIVAAAAALPVEARAGFGFLLGVIVGSYLATLAIRWPAGRGATRGRSHCDACRAPLAPRDLVPLLSFLANRGRCRQCGGDIDRAHPVAELAAGLVGALAFIFHPGLVGLGGAIFGWGLVALAILDIRHFWLPDRLTMPLVAFGFVFSWLTERPAPADSLVGATAGFFTLFLIGQAYRMIRGREGLGGGDSKLLAAIGAWLGWTMLPFVLLLASVTGLLAIISSRARGEPVTATDRFPFGAFLAVAAWPLWLARDAISAIFPGL
ncbi:prepilin peptidase [Parasphingopyxis marina]|uniref:Prepilin leader peptidase/N-methyltransferase n=1 Tax=Parasphingopyxis marina TaxID=2761622 RepID=A0A842HYS4_9SPHN|nr:A24 family peptidase [Parasphingopyxis marina]MBC2778082.1 prepilin peptidase [Parasphingopyxis marina]